MKKILSIQDISCFGQCSLTVALPILSSYGIETAILPSAILSTHTAGFKNFTVLDLTDEMPRIINHWKEENITFDSIYTGYIGDKRQFDYILDINKTLNKGLLIVDPACADHGKLYPALNSDIVVGMRELVRKADIILPNITEASFLLDIPYREEFDLEYAKEVLRKLSLLGPHISVLTGTRFSSGKIGAMAYDKKAQKYYSYESDMVNKNYHGTGDIFSSIFIASYLNSGNIEDALKEAVLFTKKCILETVGDETHSYGVHFEKVLKEKNYEE